MNNVDTTQTTTHLGLCTGYGGIELGLERVIPDMRTVALCEIEAFAIANLVAKMEAGLMDAAPVWSDLKTFPWAAFCDRVDLLTGGYPCQPFSAAGKRAGKDDPRHLWPWISDGIRIMRPRACFLENVEGHISMGLSDVIEDLVGMGYRVAWGIFSASEVGAPHQRKRVFICAVANSIPEGLQRRSRKSSDQGRLQRQARRSGDCVWPSRPGELADSECGGFRAWRCNAGTEEESKFKHCNTWPSRPSEPQHVWEPPRVVANSKGERARERSELCNKECGSGSTLSWDVEQSGERVAANARCRERVGGQIIEGAVCAREGELGQGFGELYNESESMGNTAEQGFPFSRGETGSMAESRPQSELERSNEIVGNAKSGARLGRASGEEGRAAQPDEAGGKRQAEPAMGRKSDGTASGMDYAELCVTSDNRTDELRLLGNGVVPATAERAFCVLMQKLQCGN